MDWREHPALQRQFVLAEENLRAMELFSALLNERPDYFSASEVEAFARDCGLPRDVAFEALLAAGCGLESDVNPRHRRWRNGISCPPCGDWMRRNTAKIPITRPFAFLKKHWAAGR